MKLALMIGIITFAGIVTLAGEMWASVRFGAKPREWHVNFMMGMHQVGFMAGMAVAAWW